MSNKVTENYLKRYLADAPIMQLATSNAHQPWVCSVYFVADEYLNLYWLSYPDRRHSQEIAANNKIAITIALKHDLPVIGLSAQGSASTENDPEIVAKIMKLYVQKYNEGHKFFDNFKAGTNKHKLYKFTPIKYSLFDEVNYAKDSSVDFIPKINSR